MPARYAIYFVPARDSALYRFGTSVLGYDCYTGEETASIDGAGADWHAWTAAPRAYGFHGTLKAPFHLTAGMDEVALREAVDAFGRTRAPFDAGALAIRALGSFIAIVPDRRSATLDALAQQCVEAFDRFRAPLTNHDRQRRQPSRLSERQREYLERWGYPYVFDEFRFHMTLTGSLDEPERQTALSFLCHKCPPEALDHLAIDRIAVARQAEKSARFQMLHWSLLTAGS